MELEGRELLPPEAEADVLGGVQEMVESARANGMVLVSTPTVTLEPDGSVKVDLTFSNIAEDWGVGPYRL